MGNACLPENEGAYRSVRSMNAGPIAAMPAPYVQSSPLAYPKALLQWLWITEHSQLYLVGSS
jgi:hypothetical protein